MRRGAIEEIAEVPGVKGIRREVLMSESGMNVQCFCSDPTLLDSTPFNGISLPQPTSASFRNPNLLLPTNANAANGGKPRPSRSANVCLQYTHGRLQAKSYLAYRCGVYGTRHASQVSELGPGWSMVVLEVALNQARFQEAGRPT